MKDTCTTKFGRFCPYRLVYCPQISEDIEESKVDDVGEVVSSVTCQAYFRVA